MSFDWKNPNYTDVWRQRAVLLSKINADPGLVPQLKAYYREHIDQFIDDWGMTEDPRNLERRLPVVMPFKLFPRQREWVQWVVESWRLSESGLSDKSRDMGLSWLAVSVAVSLCVLFDDVSIGFGSRKEEYVDKLGDPKSLFHKGRRFAINLPKQFRAGFTLQTAPHMRLMFPETRSVITGEAGDAIGRGDRKAIYFVDEAAHLERPLLIDASLAATTNCRIDLSSVNGMGNPFAEKRFKWAGTRKVFTFHWRDDPRKDDAWYEKQKANLDPVVVAQEVDLAYNASVEGIVIPAEWVQASIDLHIKLGIKPTGLRVGALDVADEGKDRNAFAVRHGVLLEHVESWKGEGSDLYATTERAFKLCDDRDLVGFDYDGDGLGAGVRGDARKINEARAAKRDRQLKVNQFRGSAAVDKPLAIVKGTQRTNEDYFANLKAQSWFALRDRFRASWRASKGLDYDPADIICIDSAIPERVRLVAELSQPTFDLSKSGKVLIDKQPDGVPSPNLADSVMIAFGRKRLSLVVSEEAANALSGGR